MVKIWTISFFHVIFTSSLEDHSVLDTSDLFHFCNSGKGFTQLTIPCKSPFSCAPLTWALSVSLPPSAALRRSPFNLRTSCLSALMLTCTDGKPWLIRDLQAFPAELPFPTAPCIRDTSQPVLAPSGRLFREGPETLAKLLEEAFWNPSHLAYGDGKAILSSIIMGYLKTRIGVQWTELILTQNHLPWRP